MYGDTCSELANHQIRLQATHKVGCPPGDCIWSPWGIVWVCMSPHNYFVAPPPLPPPPQTRSQMTHLMKHTSNYFIKCACVLQNIHTSSANEGDKGLQFILSLQYSCQIKECCMHYILRFHFIKELINVQLSNHLFFLSCISLSTDNISD